MIRKIALAAVLLLPFAAYAQGKLDAVREAVDQPRSATGTDTTSSSDDGGFGAAVFDSVAEALFSEQELFTNPWSTRRGKRLDWCTIDASAEIGSDFDGLTRTGLRLFLDTETRFGVRTDWDYYLERQPCGCYDQMLLGDIMGTFRFLQAEKIEMHVGAGARFLFDSGRDRAGLNLLYSFDLFPTEPVSLFGSAELGGLGNATVWRLRAGLGYNWNWGGLFAGYDRLSIGGAILQGPFVGVRLWF
jgi:hypothetical protein